MSKKLRILYAQYNYAFGIVLKKKTQRLNPHKKN
jgi:hypothetical protein